MEETSRSDLVSATVTLPQFKDIRKSTTGETYQHLNELIKGKSIENLHELISTGGPLPAFDESLRLILIDRLHLHEEVVNVLLSQNNYQIKKILNCKWYVRLLTESFTLLFFQNLSSEICTKQLFPVVSQSLRCKIINKLSKYLNNTEEAEKCFTFIRANYDNARADYLLPRCSSQFILNHFKTTKMVFEENTHKRILFNICKRYPEVGIAILSSVFDREKKRSREMTEYSRILSYLSGHHPNLMVPFITNHRKMIPEALFGRKLTKKLGARLKDRLFPDFVETLLFKQNHFFRFLPWEDKVKFVAAIVRYENAELSFNNWRNLDSRICYLLKFLPQDLRPLFIESTFREVYNSDFSDNSSCWSGSMLELLPTNSRQPYAVKLEKFLKGSQSEFCKNVNPMSFDLDNPEGVIYLYDSATAFPKLKELLRKTPSVTRRKNIIFHMVKNCSINNDKEMLEEVVERVATRHRNDDSIISYSCTEAITDNFPPMELSPAIFDKLEELLHFFILKGQVCTYVYDTLRENHIYYRLERGMDVDTQVDNFYEAAIQRVLPYGSFLRELQSKHSKTLILDLSKRAVDAIRKDNSKVLSDSSRNLLSGVLRTCSSFNAVHKRGRIYLQEIPGLSDILRRELKNEYGDAGGESWPLDIWDRYGDEVLNSYYRPRNLFYALKRNQGLIEKHLEGILNILCSDYIRTYNAFLNYFLTSVSFFGKTDRLKELILTAFQGGGSEGRRRNALTLFSRVCNIEEFTEAIRDYLPKQEKIERGSGDGYDAIQISIPRLIKNVQPQWKNLQLTLKFFFVDFLKSVLTSFFSCCHHTRCDIAIPFLKQHLNDVPPRVSYTKDIIRLILQLSNRKGRSDFCRKGWHEHEHYSVRGVLLREIFKLFLQQPCRDLFEFLEKCILECDPLTIEVRPPLGEIPEDFFNDYVSALWRFSEDKEPNFKNEFRKQMLWAFDRYNISLISTGLCEMIIKSDLFMPSSEIGVERFAALYLGADPDSVLVRVHTILDLLRSRKADAKLVQNFFRVLIETSWQDPTHSADVFEIILENWPRYAIGVLYKLRILFTYHSLHQKVVKRTPDPERVPVEFGKELKNLYENSDNLKDLIPVYSEPLSEFFSKFGTEKAIRSLRELVADSPDRSVLILAITSLPDEAVGWYLTKDEVFNEVRAGNRKIVSELVDIFESRGDVVVSIYLREKLKFSKTELML